MANSVIELSDSPGPTSIASKASSSTRKRPRADDSSNTEACQACEGTGRVAKKAKKGKKEPEPSKWPWINMRKPELQFKNTKIEFYNCGGIVFKATGKTLEDRLDKLEKWLAECEGDETAHPQYGRF
ncbi:hypothetical protein VKT23_006579 [Stygiomarasmius scandens]|uniref:Uncharacterized protein n=1 Tax=Marasmiellus scandens TaxID=2682957 RepID=A0ABR1JSV8_9AGAR